MNWKSWGYILLFFGLSWQLGWGREIHVNTHTGSDRNDGSKEHPLQTIQAAAERVYPGDIVTVHAGIYRERVNPVRGGEADAPIIFQVAEGEVVEIKGSEVIKGWKHIDKDTWMVKLPNQFFGTFNPYADTLHGDWLEHGQWSHTGEVYLDGKPLRESPSLDSLLFAEKVQPLWVAKVENDSTAIWANFIGHNPNMQQVEINVRQSVFYPEKPFVNYIHVKGFRMSHAATPWAPPTAEQIGLIGTHWSKGWVIENNVISYSKCVGITLGKYGDEWDNKSESAEAFVKTTERALQNHWNKAHIGSHLVRGNVISHCGQAGIAGSLGAVFSTITENEITEIGMNTTFWGYEIAGIKFHAPVDMTISRNHIYRTEGGIWLDWMAQGTRITGNFLHDNRLQDLSLEVNHGPILIDNNLFLSPELAQIKLSQGVRFVNNTIAWKIWPTGTKDDRQTPFLVPHDTRIAGLHDCPCGDAVYYNNLFLRVDMTPYNECLLPVHMSGNLYVDTSKPSGHDTAFQTDTVSSPEFKIEQNDEGWYLTMRINKAWKRNRQIIQISDLGKAVIPNQTFEREGIPATLDKDYLGNKRKGKQSYPGAISYKAEGIQKIKVFPLID